MTLVIVFSLVALVIASVGIYGVMSYNVVQRRGEIGIRMALGAQTRDVLNLILGSGGKLVGIGLLVGLVATFIATRAMGSILFQTSAYDPFTLGAITLAPRSGRAGRLSASRATRHAREPDRGAAR